MTSPASLHDTIDPHETLSHDEALHAHVHITPYWCMLWVFIILLALTALTVWTSNIHGFWIGNTHIELGGTLHITIAMTIAIVKALLVAAFFMHLKYDSPMNTAVVGATIFGVILFIGLTLADSATRSVMNPLEHDVVVVGGTSHMVVDPQTGEKTFVTGMGTVAAAIQNAHAHETNPTGEGHATDPAHPAEPAHEPDPAAKSGGH